jgi:hypothetical protein
VLVELNRRLMIVLLAVASLYVWSAGNVALAAEGAEPSQWRLIWKTDPATSATLAWSTAVAGKEHRVHLRQADGEKTAVVEAYRSGRYTGKSPKLYYHFVKLENLQPATKYRVVIESDGNRSPEMFFITAPTADVPVSLIFGADSRSGLEERKKMNAMIANMVAESYQGNRVPVIAFAHGGDYIRSGTNLEQWSLWMSDHELTVGKDGRLLPIIPTRGNHDHGENYNEVFAFPAGELTNYFAINLGPQVRYVTLNSETSVSGDQAEWLEAELKTGRPKNRWLLAQYHTPVYPAVKRPEANLLYWVPLFEEYNVDMVCEGDGHNIKRTAPIRESKIDSTGVVYIGEGGLGVGQRTPDAERWYLREPHGKVGSEHHVQLLTFGKEKLDYRVVLLGGEIFDEHALGLGQQINVN